MTEGSPGSKTAQEEGDYEEETKMKTIKSVLALILALCLMLTLAVPAFATEVETTVADTEGTY